MHLVDSSVLYSILLGEKSGQWALAKLDDLRSVGGVFINQIIYSEMCAFAESEEEAETVLSPLVSRVDFPWHAAFPAGRAFKLYRKRGGRKNRMLPDFLIAAHADVMGWKLVTNNARDIQSYFPELDIISPPKS
jgi:predicted nucleic acid-binding protein